MPASNRRHVVIIGASVAGLVAARVLSDHDAQVTLVDRDVLPAEPAHRRHVPQSHHIHALLARGREVMTALFPGFDEEIVARGGWIGDPGRRALVFVAGHRHCERDTDIRGVLASRLLIEDVLRTRVRANPRVTFADGTEVLGFSSEAGAVTGLRLRAPDHEYDLPADLVVDCSGRGSRTPAWLTSMGFDPPAEEELRIDMRYRSRHFRVQLAPGEDPFIMLIAATPQCRRGGVMAYQENGLYLCTLAGYAGDACADDPESFLQFAKHLPRPEMYETLLKAEVMDEVRAYGMPTNLRRRYERLRAFPRGLLVLGDAVCSFDPIYGQGMTVATLEAAKLGEWLSLPHADAKQWFRLVAPIVDTPWAICTGGDAWVLGLPEARRGMAGFVNWYLERLHACAATDPIVADAFLRVAQMYDSAPALLRPGIAWRVLRGPRAASSTSTVVRAAA